MKSTQLLPVSTGGFGSSEVINWSSSPEHHLHHHHHSSSSPSGDYVPRAFNQPPGSWPLTMPSMVPVAIPHHRSVVDLPSSCHSALPKHNPENLVFALDQLKHVEAFYHPEKSSNHLNSLHRNNIDSAQRDRVVTLMKDIHQAYFQLDDSVFSVSVNMFDRFIVTVQVPCLCAKLVISICYFIAVETLCKSILLTRESLLQLTGACKLYSVEDFFYWESAVRETLYTFSLPLALSTAMDYLQLLASGYGLTRDMILLMNDCLCHSSACTYQPCVLAISVFYASVPKSDWDSWEYPSWFAARYNIGGEDFVRCIQLVMSIKKQMMEDPRICRIPNLLRLLRERGHFTKDNVRHSHLIHKLPLSGIQEEED